MTLLTSCLLQREKSMLREASEHSFMFLDILMEKE